MPSQIAFNGPLAWIFISTLVGFGFRIGWLLMDLLIYSLKSLSFVVQSAGSDLLRWLFN
jgi:hypothetical protein